MITRGQRFTAQADPDRARKVRCLDCLAPIWVGPDVNNVNRHTLADQDPYPGDTTARTAHLLAGGTLYALIPCKGGHQLARLDDFTITEDRHPVLAGHQCPTQGTLDIGGTMSSRGTGVATDGPAGAEGTPGRVGKDHG